MVSSRAWFALAVAGVLGLFYVGHGLHSGQDAVWQLPAGNVAMAQEKVSRTLEWQRLLSKQLIGPASLIFRTKIPSGWLVLLRPSGTNGVESGVTFVPDPDHKWDGNSLD